jgi:hypothetical protein
LRHFCDIGDTKPLGFLTVALGTAYALKNSVTRKTTETEEETMDTPTHKVPDMLYLLVEDEGDWLDNRVWLFDDQEQADGARDLKEEMGSKMILAPVALSEVLAALKKDGVQVTLGGAELAQTDLRDAFSGIAGAAIYPVVRR